MNFTVYNGDQIIYGSEVNFFQKLKEGTFKVGPVQEAGAHIILSFYITEAEGMISTGTEYSTIKHPEFENEFDKTQWDHAFVTLEPDEIVEMVNKTDKK
jgi:hypothetical protein